MLDKLTENQRTWNAVADKFFEASAIPFWGPFGVGEDLHLIPEIQDQTFLEVGCGSGRSINYLIQQGARKVYGLDLSPVQLNEAAQFNQSAVDRGQVQLFNAPMENLLTIEPVDLVCSVYALGWTLDPEKTLGNIYSYLKPGGLFIWSWDHSLFSDVVYKDGEYVVEHSYHEETPVILKNWNKRGFDAHLVYRKTSTWFQLLRQAGFTIIGYYEPEPVNLSRGSDDPARYYSIQKAQKVPCTFIFVCQK